VSRKKKPEEAPPQEPAPGDLMADLESRIRDMLKDPAKANPMEIRVVKLGMEFIALRDKGKDPLGSAFEGAGESDIDDELGESPMKQASDRDDAALDEQ
jgi:hypothetical protein